MARNREQIQEFVHALNDDVRTRADGGNPYSDERQCFADSVLEMFENAAIVEAPEVCVRSGRLGRSNWEIAGWAFPPSEEEDLSELSVLAIHFLNSPELGPVSAEELRRRFELASSFIRAMLDGQASELDRDAPDAAALGRIIEMRRHQLRRVVVHLATDGLTQRLKEIESEHAGSIEIACSIWDAERLSRLTDPEQEEIEIDVPSILGGQGLPCLRVPGEAGLYNAFLCVVPGLLLHHAYEKYGQRLLELNVRAFLSVAGLVNRGIRETIRSSPARFFAYNNGLAMTARRVETRVDTAGLEVVTRIIGLQIVNGGQTTASLHRAWKIDGAREELSRVYVQGKLTEITTADGDDEGFLDLVRNISRFANSQNAVKGDDLEANQPWHVQFERLSRETWTPDARSKWYYERSRGSYATAKAREATTRARTIQFESMWPRAQMISKTDLAKAVNSWNQRPEVVSLGGQKNFRHFMDSLAEQARRPALGESEYKNTVGRVIVFRDVTKLLNQMKDDVPAFRNNVAAYLVAYLSFRMPDGLDFERVWDKQATPEAVKDLLRKWAAPIYKHIIETAMGRNPSEWCKKPGCWEAVRSLRLPCDLDLGRFSSTLGVANTSGIADADDAEAISACLRLSLDDWQRLFDWVLQTSRIRGYEKETISTLRRCALEGWLRRPSPKEARHARRLIERWREELGESSAQGASY